MDKIKIYKWFLVSFMAIALTALALIYQSMNGPTKPKKVELWLNDNQIYKFKLPRSHGGANNCLIELPVSDPQVSGEIYFRKFPTNDPWQQTNLIRVGKNLAAFLPFQPPAGKLEYYLVFRQDQKVFRIPAGDPVIIRFRGEVPAGVILPHALLMFMAMLLSNLTLFLAIFGFKQYRFFGLISFGALLAGGMILGPIVQKFAFGQYWTGFPAGLDLTDNKTLIAFIFWTVAVVTNIGKERKLWTIIAALVMLIIFSIPHSARGSELDPKTGTIKTGFLKTLKNEDSRIIYAEASYHRSFKTGSEL